MLRVGLTGGIACGKTTVAEMLARRGAHYLSADNLAHQCYAPGAIAYDEVVHRFGSGILNPDKTVNRTKLAAAVFPDRIAELNAIVHPAVIDAQKHWMDDTEHADPDGIAVVEAALLLEADARKDFDKIVVVTCGLEQKVQRYASRMGISWDAARTEVARRAGAQMSDGEKARRADYVIDNSGSVEELEQKVERVWVELKRMRVPDKR